MSTPNSRPRRRTVLVSDRYSDTPVRISLGSLHYTANDEIGTGVTARALWIGRRHVVLRTYSIWANRDGSVEGDRYSFCDVNDVAMIDRVFGEDAAERTLDVLRTPVAETIDASGQAVAS